MELNADIQKLSGDFLPNQIEIKNFDTLKPYFEDLIHREINSLAALEKWMQDVSLLQAVVSEDACMRQIKMTCDTENKALEEAFTFFCLEIEPLMKPYWHAINKKWIENTYTNELDKNLYNTIVRNAKKELALYNESNIPLQAQLQVLAQQYGHITGSMFITYEGKEYTMQQAAKFLMQDNQQIRKDVYVLLNERRLQDKDKLDVLFNNMLKLRNEIAFNAGYKNFRDYKHFELGRFDYSVEDCFTFHEAVKKYIKPLCEKIYEHKKHLLQLDVLKPYDIDAEPTGSKPLEPFTNANELLEKSILVFEQLHPYFAACLHKMNSLQHFDLDSRKGKAPGGYNCPLAVSGAPFIFMNAAGTADDVVTMMHEGGHAIHSFLSHALPLTAMKEYPMEIAELASMSMELFTMEYWHTFYPNKDDLKRAKIEELERALTIFPWIATIDKFQHWIYTHPQHTVEERTDAWIEIYNEFAPSNISWDGLEQFKSNMWQKQLHIFEVPFYYIEYGIAQLGALAMWKQYKDNPQKTIENYINALALGGTKTLPELYEAAGVSFQLSDEYIASIASFTNSQLQEILQ